MTDRIRTNILLVDDQPAKLLSLELVLAQLDENVMKASCADEALAILLEHDVAVVLVDVCMPGMDGFELAELIRQHPRFRRTAIIFISAVHLSDDDRLRGYNLGAVDYIPVPIVPEVLRAKVSIFTELHRKTEQLYRLNEELERRVAQRTADVEASAARLRESEQRYRRLVHSLPAAVYTCDADGRVTLYNQAAVELWGREPELGKDLWCGSWRIYRTDGTPMEHSDCPMAVALTSGRILRNMEIVVERPDGVRRTVVPHPELIFDAAGRLIGAVNMLVDVTDARNAEQARALLAEIVASSEDAIFSATLDGTITSWNHGAERIFGYTASEVIGNSVYLLIPPDRQTEESAIIAQLRRGERVHSIETVRVGKGGRNINVSLTVSPLRDSTGELIGISKAARDITDRKRAEEILARDRETLEHLVAERTRELELSVKRLRLADRMAMIGTLSAGLGHDMGNLLLPIRMRLDSIDAAEIPPAVREDVVAIRKASEYLQRLAASLRLLALDPERESQVTNHTDLASWWYEAEGMIRNGLPRHVELTFQREELHAVAVGKATLSQMIFNVVQNAGDALKSRQGGTVAITSERVGAMIRIRIRDDGPGMAEDARQRCLEPFYTTKTRGLSTGLGLALVSGLVSRAGGTIQIESSVGQGTTVILDLPATAETGDRAAPDTAARSLAVVNLQDAKLQAHVRSILKAMSFEISDMGLDRADLWVTEQFDDGDILAAKNFVDSRPLRRAVIFSPHAAAVNGDARIAVVAKSTPPSALRSRMYGLLATKC